MITYKVHFVDGSVLTFKAEDMDFHKVRGGLFCWCDLIFNMDNVLYFEKMKGGEGE